MKRYLARNPWARNPRGLGARRRPALAVATYDQKGSLMETFQFVLIDDRTDLDRPVLDRRPRNSGRAERGAGGGLPVRRRRCTAGSCGLRG